jgi:protein-S-isoprenylcysteine O-methyltransferase Ste14
MALLPGLSAGWLNGWILLLAYGLVLGVVVRSFPQEVIARLYDRSHWTPQQRVLTTIGKVFGGVFFLLLAFSPLRIGHPVFVVGAVLFALGMMGLVIALVHFRNAPLDQPATRGLYGISRNPQWIMLVLVFLGVGLAVGSWTALLVLAGAVICYHFRILAEERSCLSQYGDDYRGYMGRVPRYLPFL